MKSYGKKALLAGIPFMIISFLLWWAPNWVQSIDQGVLNLMINLRNDFLNKLFLSVTWLGNTDTVTNLTILSVVVLIFLINIKTGIFYGLAVIIGNLGINPWVKNLVQRPRPDAVYRLVEMTSFSYPSGHSFVAAMVYPLLAYLLLQHKNLQSYKKIVVGILILFMLMIPLSRVYLGVHYLSDVLAGLSLGLSFYFLCVGFYEAFLKEKSK